MVDKPMILVVYSSMSGHTQAMADAIADGARGGQNVLVEVKRPGDVGPTDLEHASAIAFGSPTYFSYMTGELKTLFDRMLPHKEHLDGKPVIAFATGEGGQVTCIKSIEDILSYFGANILLKSDILSAGLAVQGIPDERAKKIAMEAGKKLSDAGIQYVCGKAKREQGLTYGVHTGR